MKINKAWHEAHRRLEWHLSHALNRGCREMPQTIREELEGRGLLQPTPRSLK